MPTFNLHKVRSTGRSEFRQPGSTATIRCGKHVFTGAPPASIEVTADNIAAPNQAALDKQKKRDEAKAAKEQKAKEKAAEKEKKAAEKKAKADAKAAAAAAKATEAPPPPAA